MSDKPIEEMTFEQAMAELEAVVDQLDRGDVALDESIKLYERGALLKKRCERKLKEAEEKVAAITLDEDGNPNGTVEMDGLQNLDKELKTNSSIIDEHFKFVFQSIKNSCVNDAMQYALLGGKKLRGYLVNQSSKLFDIDFSKSIWAACSIEALHAYSLVHDDLPD